MGGGGTSSKISVSPNKKADDWDSDIDDLLGDDSDDEVKRTFEFSFLRLNSILLSQDVSIQIFDVPLYRWATRPQGAFLPGCW